MPVGRAIHNKEESAVHFAVTRSFTQKRSSDNNEQTTGRTEAIYTEELSPVRKVSQQHARWLHAEVSSIINREV